MKIKICGLKTPEEALYLNENKVEYAGMVLYFKKATEILISILPEQ